MLNIKSWKGWRFKMINEMMKKNERGVSELFMKFVGSAPTTAVVKSPVIQQKQSDIVLPWTFVRGVK